MSILIPVVTVKTYDPLKIPRSFIVLGDLLDRKDEAAEFLPRYNTKKKQLADRTKELTED